MLCPCCNYPVDPEFAQDHNYCVVCWKARCSTLDEKHDETNLLNHHEQEETEL